MRESPPFGAKFALSGDSDRGDAGRVAGRTFVFNVYVIPSRSMEDTLQIGDRVFASRLTPRLFTLHRGDIIVFKDPADWMEGEQLPTI